jgi:hypothetical protein
MLSLSEVINDNVNIDELVNPKYIVNIKSYVILKILLASISSSTNVDDDNKKKCTELVQNTIYKLEGVHKIHNIEIDAEKFKSVGVTLMTINKNKLYRIGNIIMDNINKYHNMDITKL